MRLARPTRVASSSTLLLSVQSNVAAVGETQKPYRACRHRTAERANTVRTADPRLVAAIVMATRSVIGLVILKYDSARP